MVWPCGWCCIYYFMQYQWSIYNFHYCWCAVLECIDVQYAIWSSLLCWIMVSSSLCKTSHQCAFQFIILWSIWYFWWTKGIILDIWMRISNEIVHMYVFFKILSFISKALTMEIFWQMRQVHLQLPQLMTSWKKNWWLNSSICEIMPYSRWLHFLTI